MQQSAFTYEIQHSHPHLREARPPFIVKVQLERAISRMLRLGSREQVRVNLHWQEVLLSSRMTGACHHVAAHHGKAFSMDRGSMITAAETKCAMQCFSPHLAAGDERLPGFAPALFALHAQLAVLHCEMQASNKGNKAQLGAP